MFSRVNDTYDPLTVERDFNSLWNTGYFENVRIEQEETPKGVILDVYVTEKPTIREINYKGLNSVTQSDVLDRFKKEKVGLSVESQYDPTGSLTPSPYSRSAGRAWPPVRHHQGRHQEHPARLGQVNFIIKEGPKVKVGKITFTGNEHVTSRVLRESMKNLRPIGIPHSIILENLFARTYDASKLEEDSERVRQAYRDRGYFRASVADPQTHLRNETGLSCLPSVPGRASASTSMMPIDEGAATGWEAITFPGNKAVTNVKALRGQFPTKDGDWFNATVFGKGLENLRKAYGQLGYINFAAIPNPTIDEAKKTVCFNIDMDEGKPFYVARIEFQGNTVTRDLVIRRELLLQEGQVYNSHLWELSLLRLNQLDYFNPLRSSRTPRPIRTRTTAPSTCCSRSRKRARTPSASTAASAASAAPSSASTTRPTTSWDSAKRSAAGQRRQPLAQPAVRLHRALFPRPPHQPRLQVFDPKYDYNEAKNYWLTSGNRSISQSQQSLLQNYNQNTTGFTISASYAVPRSFKLFGITYGYRPHPSRPSPRLEQPLPDAGLPQRLSGQNALNGILTSSAS